MKKLILPALIFGAIAVSCKKEETKTTESNSTEQVAQTEQTEDKDENVTTFEGKFPCADCSGIETKLILNKADNTYILENKYVGKENGEFTDKGTFETSEDGKYITLKAEGDAGDPLVYLLTDDVAYQVTKVGDTELKEDYKLFKK